MEKCLIVAISQNGVIGRDNKIPWKLDSDISHFREVTFNTIGTHAHAVIMGRNTWFSIPQRFRPLAGRINIIVSKTLNQSSFEPTQHVHIVRSLDEGYALAEYYQCAQAFVIGGVRLYREALFDSEVLYLTYVKAHIDGDVFLWDFLRLKFDWCLAEKKCHPADGHNQYPFEFQKYFRITE